ncbi:MAG: YdcF family protein [Kiloniellaceae bacterium]
MLYSIVTALVLPPTCFFVLLFLALLVKWRRPRLGKGLLWALLLLVYLSTTPFVAGELMAPLQPYGPIDPEQPDPEVGAIVVLGAGVYYGAPEYWQPSFPLAYAETADSLSLERVEYAAYLARMTGIPILVSGGATGPDEQLTIARTLKQTLERDFAVPVRWVEEGSVNTWMNAQLSAEILKAQGIRKIYLVTHAWHMPRAMFSFQETGIEAIPAPTRFESRSELIGQDFVPSAKAFLDTHYAIYEWLGFTWYRLRGQSF